MTCLAVIPARYGSSRFPGKPLAIIAGKPMVLWAVDRALASGAFDRIIVATDDARILQTVTDAGFEAMMTSPDHPSGSDRVWEVAQTVPEAQIIFNIQGDEPSINPDYLADAARWLTHHHEEADIVTLHTPLRDVTQWRDPNIVKTVSRTDGQALYFSRAPIPAERLAEGDTPTLAGCFRHLGLYGYTRKALEHFVSLPPSPLEQREMLEQLRALEAGMRIQLITVDEAPIGVDTPEDIALIERHLSAI